MFVERFHILWRLAWFFKLKVLVSRRLLSLRKREDVGFAVYRVELKICIFILPTCMSVSPGRLTCTFGCTSLQSWSIGVSLCFSSADTTTCRSTGLLLWLHDWISSCPKACRSTAWLVLGDWANISPTLSCPGRSAVRQDRHDQPILTSKFPLQVHVLEYMRNDVRTNSKKLTAQILNTKPKERIC